MCFHAHSPILEEILGSLKKTPRLWFLEDLYLFLDLKGSKVFAGIVRSSHFFHVLSRG